MLELSPLNVHGPPFRRTYITRTITRKGAGMAAFEEGCTRKTDAD